MLAIDPNAAPRNRKDIYKKLAKHTVTLFSFFLAVRAAYPSRRRRPRLHAPFPRLRQRPTTELP